ncbi:tape measure chaperone [Citrobacter phage IME-JL8]|uniref:Tail tape measure chaperone n=3 Tax=Sertoctavirus TaxID=2560227 RepID=A0AAE8AY23_9CAUD|nr:tail length tape measure protein [Escherichia phage SRT8]ATN93795.1 tape measure chaperone [Escherichia phage SRT8]QIG62002.1 tape measure chaperone [Citrobacter phage IME-JL8]QXV76497.1 tail tape measure chaperone [Escherichia phage BrunoManser]
MAKFKITLGALPDFALPVKFIMPNGDEAKITFKVKHRPSNEVQELYDRQDIKDHDFIMELASGWDLEEEFNQENAEMLVRYYPGAALALTSTYLRALAGQRVKN